MKVAGALSVVAAALALLASVAQAQIPCTAPAIYDIAFVGRWNATNQAGQFPPGAAFGPVIFASHNSNISIFVPGQPVIAPVATWLSSTFGDNTTDLVNAATALQGTAIDQPVASAGVAAEGITQASLSFTSSFSLFSVAAKLLPSSDWFVGLSDLNLCQNGFWVPIYTADLPAYDAGVLNSTLSFTDPGTPLATPVNVTTLGVTLPVTPAYVTITYASLPPSPISAPLAGPIASPIASPPASAPTLAPPPGNVTIPISTPVSSTAPAPGPQGNGANTVAASAMGVLAAVAAVVALL